MVLLIYLIIALLVVLAWSRLFLTRDRFEPEPRSLLIKLFLAGAIPVGMLAGAVNVLAASALPDGLVITLVGPANEEAMKLGAVFLVAFGSRHFTQKVDGAIYGISCGLGFAAAENVEYALSFGPGALGLRSLLVPLGHPLFTGMSGYYLGRYKFERKRILILRGFAIAVLFHAMWNAPAGFAVLAHEPYIGLLHLPVLLLAILALSRFLHSMSTPDAQKIHDLVLPHKPAPHPR
jgi:RsiW-degrading membrane proteinase PrsW (M82 family)